MSIENNLASIAQSLATIADYLVKQHAPAAVVSAAANVTPPPAPVQVAPAPVVAPVVQPVPMPSVEPIQQVAPAPVAAPAAPAPVTAPSAPMDVPFSDAKGLIGYVMETYKALGTEKGAHIQNVLNSLGYQNINEVKPESYTALYAGIEALK